MSPSCVPHGGAETITVKTLPKSAVGFNTFYSDGQPGGSANGQGYGGNSGGETTDAGVYTFTWAISPKAPAGPVRVDVVDATPDGIVRATAGFTVANLQGSC
jgi:hypothetical protein